ncbi:MAG TPA: D-alanine--D-alanine ligase, partial [Deltaproteobacteria bacterium]|nr:D-alanine--D-alanine ligase [Deltaproteobacteria bacterium]
AKTVVRASNIPTPDFFVVEDARDAASCALDFPLFVKPVAEGTGKGVSASSRVESTDGLLEACTRLLAEFGQAVLVEKFLPGREFTAGILGTGRKARVAGVMEVVPLKGDVSDLIYSYHTKSNYQDLVAYRVPDSRTSGMCGEVALAAWRALGCRDGGRVDLRMDENGVPHFIEVNPLAGLNPVHSDLPILCRLAGMGYSDLIAAIVESACERIARGVP